MHDLPPAPTPSTLPKVSAAGDPHLVNIMGQHFDIYQAGIHVLLQVPRGVQPEDALIRVEADARQLGGACADLYFQTLNITGHWVSQQLGKDGQPLRSGLLYRAGSPGKAQSTNWMRFGGIELKVARGHTHEGLEYLNMYARHLIQLSMPIGGLLGLDDHTQASIPTQKCKRVMTLLSLLEVRS